MLFSLLKAAPGHFSLMSEAFVAFVDIFRLLTIQSLIQTRANNPLPFSSWRIKTATVFWAPGLKKDGDSTDSEFHSIAIKKTQTSPVYRHSFMLFLSLTFMSHMRGHSYVIVPCLDSRELPNDKFHCRLQVLVNKIGGLRLGITACLERRREKRWGGETQIKRSIQCSLLFLYACLLLFFCSISCHFLLSWSGLLYLHSSPDQCIQSKLVYPGQGNVEGSGELNNYCNTDILKFQNKPIFNTWKWTNTKNSAVT